MEEVADAVLHLSLSDLDRLSVSLLTRLPDRGTTTRQFQESVLLYAIHESLPDEQQERYATLIARRRTEKLTEAEYAELLELTQLAEAMDARRLELLNRLAALRKIPLRQLISELHLSQLTV